jgi:hypothetical protein
VVKRPPIEEKRLRKPNRTDLTYTVLVAVQAVAGSSPVAHHEDVLQQRLF